MVHRVGARRVVAGRCAETRRDCTLYGCILVHALVVTLLALV